MNFKAYIADKLKSVTGLEYDVIESNIETPPDDKMGDLAFPCFVLAKTMRKAPPVIAKEISERLSGSDEIIGRTEATGGYVNFFFNRSKFAAETVRAAAKAGENHGGSDMGKGKTVLVEYSSPNIAKPFHIGHLFSTAVGNSLAKIYKHLGYNVVSLNHLGDWGTQFGKLISAYKRWGDKDVIDKDPINELLKIYVKFHEEAEKHPELGLEDEAREYFKRLEDGDAETTDLWKYFRDISLVEFKRVYDTLGVEFDSYNGEAFYSDKMKEIVDILDEKGLLTESDGAKVVDLSDMNIPPCIILKSNGATIYATRDIAAALYRRRTYDFYKNIYVVGTPQALHFRQIFSVMERAGWEWSRDCVHVGFGLVRFDGQNLSTRHGNVVFLNDVLNESIAKTREIIEKSNPDTPDKEDTAKKIGVGALLYTFLKNNREKDIDLNWDSMLDFDGESAPYCQYSYARGKSILRRAGGIDFSDADFSEVSDEEYALVKHINDFGDAVKNAADKNEPFYINRYVTNLARLFNRFYNANPILKEGVDENVKKSRLALVDVSCSVIKTALGLLGIETVETM
ncbi:MAG: arginine--tRNA ligase [Oscillospiraceae bacterium]|nr:arginine--tRNA ligase [Oscillospiraceae bacterium]